VLLGIFVVALAACKDSKVPATELSTHVHSDGWQIRAPAFLDAKLYAGGIDLTDGSRAMQGIDVEVRRGSPPAGVWRKRRTASGIPARYRILVETGGMGGPEYELQIWQPRRDGYVWLSQSEQREWPDHPRWGLGWQIFASMKMK
jgi:hypothetical protein